MTRIIQKRPPHIPKPPAPAQETGFYDSYVGHARVLRTWLAAYGIGAPVLLASQQHVATVLRGDPYARTIVLAFLVGALIQVTVAVLYKSASWYGYCNELDTKFGTTWRYRFSHWYASQYWLEVLADVITVAAYVYGTARLLILLTGPVPVAT